ncbi:unnamed protein product [Boreogadus saida]
MTVLVLLVDNTGGVFLWGSSQGKRRSLTTDPPSLPSIVWILETKSSIQGVRSLRTKSLPSFGDTLHHCLYDHLIAPQGGGDRLPRYPTLTQTRS